MNEFKRLYDHPLYLFKLKILRLTIYILTTAKKTHFYLI